MNGINVLRGVMVVAVLTGIAAIVSCQRSLAHRQRFGFDVFAPLNASLRIGDEVMVEGQHLGLVEAIQPAVGAVTLVARRPLPTDQPVSVTLTESRGILPVVGDLDAQFVGPDRLVMRALSDTVLLRATGYPRMRWHLERGPADLLINGELPAPGPRDRAAGFPVGSTLAFGGWLIRIDNIHLVQPSRIGFDLAGVRKAVTKTGRPWDADVMLVFGPGAAIELGSGLGLTRSDVRLRLAPFRPGPPPSVAPTEIAVHDGGDWQTALASLSALASPGSLHDEPASQIELVVHNVNATLAGTRAALATITGVVQDIGGMTRQPGWLGRAAMRDSTRGHLDGAVAHLDGAITHLDGQLQDSMLSPIYRLRAVATDTRRAVNGIADTVGRHVHTIGVGADTLLIQLRHETSRDTTSLVAHLNRAVGSISADATAVKKKAGTVALVTKLGLLLGALAVGHALR